MAKISKREVYTYDSTSKFQEYEIGSDLITFMQSKIQICKTDFLQTKRMWNQKYLKICLTDFF